MKGERTISKNEASQVTLKMMRFAALLAYASVSSYRDLVESFMFLFIESLLLCNRVFYCFHIDSNMIHREFRIVCERKSILCL